MNREFQPMGRGLSERFVLAQWETEQVLIKQTWTGGQECFRWRPLHLVW